MPRLAFLTLGFLLALSVPVLADCVEDIDTIEEAYNAATDLDEEEKAVIEDALTDAMANTANEEECQAALDEAREILGVE